MDERLRFDVLIKVKENIRHNIIYLKYNIMRVNILLIIYEIDSPANKKHDGAFKLLG